MRMALSITSLSNHQQKIMVLALLSFLALC
jgi:hypothetical protein